MKITPSTNLSTRLLANMSLVPVDEALATLQRKKQVRLKEDEYIQAVSSIIERDFFPHLKKMRLENELLDAMDNVELDRVRELGHQLKEMERENQGETTETSDGQSVVSRPQYNINMSLDAFMSRYTSEDNASFADLMVTDSQLKKEQYKWMYSKEKRQLLIQNGTDKALLIEGDSAIPVDPKGFITGSDYKVTICLIYRLSFDME